MMTSAPQKDNNHVWYREINRTYIPLHVTFVGSGSHSPFSIHVVVLGPVSTIPGGHVNMMVVPNSTGSTESDVRMELSINTSHLGTA